MKMTDAEIQKMDRDLAAIACSHCGHKFIVDIADFIETNLKDFGPNPRYMGARCPECYLETVVNIVNPLSSQRPMLRSVR
jgi:DNA-directed RNA polymerase subunit RPC12/RpoP